MVSTAILAVNGQERYGQIISARDGCSYGRGSTRNDLAGERFIQPPTAAGKKRQTIVLRFVAAQYVIITAFALLSVEHVLQPRLLGIFGLANFIGSILILSVALKRAPVSDGDITREQRVRAVKSSKLLIAIYVFALINGVFYIGKVPLIGIVVGIAVNVLILIGLITNLRRNQAKLNASNQ